MRNIGTLKNKLQGLSQSDRLDTKEYQSVVKEMGRSEENIAVTERAMALKKSDG